jgi:type 1 fimbriae regulatory protein FimB/type 1 fimbriae regulatory protein FimE
MRKSPTPSITWTTQSIQYLTQDELRRLLNVIKDKRDTALFLLSYRHGLRASEVGLLQTQDLDFSQQRIRIHRFKKSNGGVQPLRPDEAKAIKAYLRQRPYASPILFTSKRRDPTSRRQLDNLIKAYGTRANLPESKRHFHVLKHSIATHLLDAGADLRFVQDWIGHASINNTVLYAQLTNRKRDEEARRIFMSAWVV